MAKDLRLDVVTTSDGKGLIETAVEADEAAKKIDKLGKQMRETAVDGGILDVELEATKKQLKDLGAQFDQTGDKSILKTISSTRRYSGQLKQLKKDLEDTGKSAEQEGEKLGKDLGDGTSNGFLKALEDGKIGPFSAPVLLGVLTSPGTLGILAQAGALMGGAVLTGIGLAGIGSGIALSIHSGPVQAAITHLKQDVGDGLAAASSSFVAPTQHAIQMLENEFNRLQPGIKHVFDSISPELDKISTGFGGFIEQVVPAIGRAIEASKPLLDVLAADLPGLGTSLAGLFDTISKNSGVAEIGLQGIFTILEGIISLASSGIQGLSNVFRTMQDIALRVAEMNDKILAFAIATATYLHLPTGPLQDLLRSSERLTGQIQATSDMADGASASMGALGGEAQTTAGNVDRLATDLQNFNTQLAAMNGLLNRTEALNNLTIGMADFAKQLGKTKDAFDANTAAGATNQNSYIGLIKNAEQYRQTLIDSGVTQAQADLMFQDMVKKIDAVAEKAGLSATQIADLNKQLGITADMKPIVVPINIKTIYTYTGKKPTLGTGDIPTYASGGRFNPGPMIVGERGPELLIPDGSGTIIPDLKQGGGRGGGSAMGGGPTLVQLAAVSGDRVAEVLLSLLRPVIRGQYGGDVTAALAGNRN